MSDPRFARLKSDPRFRRPKKQISKVSIDKRFQSVFEKGKNKANKTDKYGRALSKSHDSENLRRFYKLEDEDSTSKIVDYARGGVLMESSDEEESDEESDGGAITFDPSSSKRHARENIEEEIDLDENNFADLDAQVAAYNEALEEEESEPVQKTNRLAVVNLDWDHVRAVHLFKVFSSLVDPTAPALDASTSMSKKDSSKTQKYSKSTITKGRVLSVRIYPSQFGKERLAREEKEGPPAEVFKKRIDDNEEDVDEETLYEVGEGKDYNEDALRQYQLERLRYYYAIVTCDTVEAASHIFDELEGTEFERSANVFDLSFVPDGMSFDDDPRDEATEAAGNYKGLDFVTDALRHSRVKLTWDEDDPERNQVTRRKLTREEIDGADFRAYIASSESESEEEDGNLKKVASRDRLRSLLLGGDNEQLPEGWGREDGGADDSDVDMEVTFAPGLSSTKDPDGETTLERYQRKMREKRKKQKESGKMSKEVEEDEFFEAGTSDDEEKLESASTDKQRGLKTQSKNTTHHATSEAELALLATSDDPNDDKKHFDFKAVIKAEKNKKRKGKGKRKEVVDQDEIQKDFHIDVNDQRFAAIHEDHAFAIDPSHPQFKKTKGMSALLEERASRQRGTKGKESDRRHRTDNAASLSNQKSLDSLVESVKRKSNAAHNGGKGKRAKV